MKNEEFMLSLAVSAFLVALVAFSGAAKGMSLLSACFFIALSQAAYFALLELRKAGMHYPSAELAVAAIAFAAFFFGAMAFVPYAVLPAYLSFIFVPLMLVAPALSAVLYDSFFSG